MKPQRKTTADELMRLNNQMLHIRREIRALENRINELPDSRSLIEAMQEYFFRKDNWEIWQNELRGHLIQIGLAAREARREVEALRTPERKMGANP